MSEQQPLDATFFAFKKRERPFVLTAASIAYLLLVLLVTVAFFAVTWGAWSQLIPWYIDAMSTISSGGSPQPPSSEIMLAMAPYWLAGVPISLLLFAAYEAACLRWLVRGEAGGGLFGLKLDADTWRVACVYLFWILYFVVAGLAVCVFYALLIALGQLGGVARIAAMLLGALAPIGALWLLIWGAVLFASAAATSVGRRKLTFVSARKVSTPRFWPLLTSYFLVIIGYFVIATIASTIIQIPIGHAMAPVTASIVSGGDSMSVMTSLREAMLTPVMIAVLVLNVVATFALSSLYYIAMFGVNARAFEAAAEAGDVERAA